jgi:DNA polymerase/3'-5' exonuclease PolX
MSEGVKRPYKHVMRVAEVFARTLAPACHRIAIAGSLRREKEMVGDIEIVAIPKTVTKTQTDLFGETVGDTTESLVDEALAGWPLTFHKTGEKYKQFSFEWQPSWTFKVDLFLPNKDTWGVVFLLRTGSHLFSKRMVTARSYGGLKPEAYTVEHGRVRVAGMLLPTPEEQDVFELWKMDWIDPKDRV